MKQHFINLITNPNLPTTMDELMNDINTNQKTEFYTNFAIRSCHLSNLLSRTARHFNTNSPHNEIGQEYPEQYKIFRKISSKFLPRTVRGAGPIKLTKDDLDGKEDELIPAFLPTRKKHYMI